MKKIIIILISGLLILSGCDNNDRFKKNNTYTTFYPITYITKYLYSSYSNIKSIYPYGTNIDTYELTNKMKDIYSKGETFIYSGITNEKNIAVDFLNLNRDINIIDSTNGMKNIDNIEKLWLDPLNYLMLASNIKNGLKEFTENIYEEEDIDKLYNNLKIEISELDVEFKQVIENANYKKILASDDLFKYLEKYNIEVLSLDNKNENIDKSINEANQLIKKKDIKYIFIKKGESLTKEIDDYITKNNITKLEINTLKNLTDDEIKNNEDYITIIKKNLEEYKKELYK